MKKNRFSRGFTLIELLVVIIVIAILATIAMVSYSQATRSARDGRRRTDIESVRQALILQRQDVGAYTAYTGMSFANFNTYVDALAVANFISDPAPRDPTNTGTLRYTLNSTANTFCICAQLENTTRGNSNGSCSFAANGTHYCATQP